LFVAGILRSAGIKNKKFLAVDDDWFGEEISKNNFG